MDHSISSPSSTRSFWTRDDIKRTIEENTIVVFVKGSTENPRCGFSERVINEVEAYGRPFEIVDVYKDRSILPALKAYAGLEYLPLVYVEGSLVSSSETQQQMLTSGALRDKIERAFTP